jgi:hypothetical protein
LFRFFHDLIRAAGVAFLASLAGRFLAAEAFSNLIIISSIMPLVPGRSDLLRRFATFCTEITSRAPQRRRRHLLSRPPWLSASVPGIFLYRLIPL